MAGVVAAAAATLLGRILGSRDRILSGSAPGEPGRFEWRHAPLFFTRRGQGPPALLLHDQVHGASGIEMATLGDRLSETFTVYTLDLPGYGRSGKPAMKHDEEFFGDALVEFVRYAIGEPALVVASGRSAEFACRVAVTTRDAVDGLVLISPPDRPGPDVARVPGTPLIVWSSRTSGDPLAPERYCDLRPDAALHVVPATPDRRPHVEAPGAVARAILDWNAEVGR